MGTPEPQRRQLGPHGSLVAPGPNRFLGDDNGEPTVWLPDDAATRILPGFARLSELPPGEPVEWFVQNWLARRKLQLLAGPPGLGKSTLVLEIIARLSRGEPALPGALARDPMSCLVVLPEDGVADTTVPRLQAAGADLERVITFRTDSESFELPKDAGRLRAQVEAANVGLVVIDPLTAVMSPDLNLNHQQDVRQALQPLVEMGNATGCATLLLHHLNKSASASAAHRIAGSTAVLAIARVAWVMAPHPNDPQRRIVGCLKSNLGPVPSTSFQFALETSPDAGCARIVHQGESELTADDLFAPADAPEPIRKPTRVDEANRFVRDQLLAVGGCMESTRLLELAKRAGNSEASIQRALRSPEFGKEKAAGQHGVWLTTLRSGIDGDGDPIDESELEVA